MSAACRMGYVKSPTFNKESSTSDSSLAFLEIASRDCNHICIIPVVKNVYMCNTDAPSTSSSASVFRSVLYSSESKQVLHGSEPIRPVISKPNGQRVT